MLGLPPDIDYTSSIQVFALIIANDFLARSVFMILKSFAVLIVPYVLSQRKIGLLYSFLEGICDLYRWVLPAPVWLRFFFTQGSVIASFIFPWFYIVFKIPNTWKKFSLIGTHLYKLLFKDAPYGRYATTQEISDLASRNELCPICQDNFEHPIVLNCHHYFCQTCVSSWLDGKTTCPVCRSQVPSSGTVQYPDGATSTHILCF